MLIINEEKKGGRQKCIINTKSTFIRQKLVIYRLNLTTCYHFVTSYKVKMHEIKHQSSGEINKLNEFWIEKLERGKNIENDKHKELLVQVIEDLIWEFELKTCTMATKQLPICTDAVSS